MWFGKKPFEVVCVGSTSKDVFFPTDEGVIIETPEDITSKVKVAFELGGKCLAEDRYEAVGGVAANVACGLGRLGRRVACYAKAGDDDMGRWAMGELQKNGVSTELFSLLKGVKTDLSAIVVMTQNAERVIFHNRDAAERLIVGEEGLRDAEWLFVSALNGDWKGNLKKVIDIKDQYGPRLALNPGQHNLKEDAGLVLQAVRRADILVLNKDEAIELIMHAPEKPTREELDDEQFLLAALHESGAKVVGMTDGKRGAWGYDGKEMWYCPIHTRGGIVDSTGCGDAFGSGFFAALLEGQSLDMALRYGMAQSGSVVGFYGAIEGLLRPEEMEALVQKIIPKRLK